MILRDALSRTESLKIEYCGNEDDCNEKSDNVSESDDENSDTDNKKSNCADEGKNVEGTSDLAECKAVEDVNVLNCNLCGQVFTEDNKESHMKTCHDGDLHCCCICKKKYKNLKVLKRHLKIHR